MTAAESYTQALFYALLAPNKEERTATLRYAMSFMHDLSYWQICECKSRAVEMFEERKASSAAKGPRAH